MSMIELIVLGVVGIAVLVVSTDQFVSGAAKVAEGMRASSVLVGAVILGCGIGLPEFALAFHGERHSPFREVLGLNNGGSHAMGLIVVGVVLVLTLTFPFLFPDRVKRHSPLILLATILFAALLRGSLDRVEGFAMLIGFVCGVAWVLRATGDTDDTHDDPFTPRVDDYRDIGGYVETPVMTPVQLEALRALAGLFGTIIGAQLLAQSVGTLLRDAGHGPAVQGMVLVAFGSILPHVVVALQALRQNKKGLAVGNMIGSNLFHSLAVGGLVAVIKPYEQGGRVGLATLLVLVTTASITYLLLRSDGESMMRRHALALVGSYLVLAAITVV